MVVSIILAVVSAIGGAIVMGNAFPGPGYYGDEFSGGMAVAGFIGAVLAWLPVIGLFYVMAGSQEPGSGVVPGSGPTSGLAARKHTDADGL